MAGSRLFCIDVELLGLAGRLGASPSDDTNVLKSMSIKSSARQMNDTSPLIA